METQELITDTLFLSNTVASQYKQVDVLRNLNLYYDEAVTEAWKCDSNWKFDKGYDTLPIATASLVKNQRDYQLPTEAKKIERVECLGKNNKWNVLTPILAEDVPADSDEKGMPRRYYIKGRSLFLYPLPEEAREGGLTIYLSRNVEPLLENDDEPKIDKEFHRYLSVGASLDWYFAKGNVQKAREMERKLEGIKQSMKDFYSARNADYKSRIKLKLENYN